MVWGFWAWVSGARVYRVEGLKSGVISVKGCRISGVGLRITGTSRHKRLGYRGVEGPEMWFFILIQVTGSRRQLPI